MKNIVFRSLLFTLAICLAFSVAFIVPGIGDGGPSGSIPGIGNDLPSFAGIGDELPGFVGIGDEMPGFVGIEDGYPTLAKGVDPDYPSLHLV